MKYRDLPESRMKFMYFSVLAVTSIIIVMMEGLSLYKVKSSKKQGFKNIWLRYS